MRTVNYSEILRGSAGPAGMIFPDDIGTAELALFRGFHDRRLQSAWEIEAWPDVCRTQKRYFRPRWDSTESYGATTADAPVERFDIVTGQYFQSIVAANLNHAPTVDEEENSAYWALCRSAYSGDDWAENTDYAVGDIRRNPEDNEFYQCHTAHTSSSSFDATKFGVLVPFVRRIEFEQVEDDGTAHTVIGEFLVATDKDPRVTTRSQPELAFTLDDEGAVFTTSSLAFVWLKFRIRRPELTGDAWDAEEVYTSGRQVYYLNETTKVANFYEANQTTTAAESPVSAASKWDLVEIPYIFGGYLKEGGFADWLTGDGQDEKAGQHEGMAMNYLELEADKLWRQQGQAKRLNWRR